ncbi:MAG: hypothetical protein EOO70_07130 [Myxococcaceae bacterium]|nr:MAG: hypothetical protein EOO70_07130 [Myxococcaceae bacterium]
MKVRETVAVFAAAGLLAGLVTSASRVYAANSYRINAMGCMPLPQYDALLGGGTGAWVGSAGQQFQDRQFFCPAPDFTPSNLKSQVTDVYVDVWLPYIPNQTNGTVSAMVCTNSYNGYSYACGAPAHATAQGGNGLHPSHTVWSTHSSDYGSVWVNLAMKSSDGTADSTCGNASSSA